MWRALCMTELKSLVFPNSLRPLAFHQATAMPAASHPTGGGDQSKPAVYSMTPQVRSFGMLGQRQSWEAADTRML